MQKVDRDKRKKLITKKRRKRGPGHGHKGNKQIFMGHKRKKQIFIKYPWSMNNYRLLRILRTYINFLL